MENFNIYSLYIVLFFIVAMSLLALIFYIFKKTFESKDETEFGIQNKLIGRIWHKKKPNSENDNAI